MESKWFKMRLGNHYPQPTFVKYFLLKKKKKDFIYLFLEKGEGREKEEEKHQCVATLCVPPVCSHPGTQPSTQACALTGN